MPEHLSGSDLERGQTGLAGRAAHIGDWNVHMVLIGRESPLDAAAAVTHLDLPQHFPRLSGSSA
jgi:hypothetical protein